MILCAEWNKYFVSDFSDANLGIRQKYEFAQVDDTNKEKTKEKKTTNSHSKSSIENLSGT